MPSPIGGGGRIVLRAGEAATARISARFLLEIRLFRGSMIPELAGMVAVIEPELDSFWDTTTAEQVRTRAELRAPEKANREAF